MGTTTPQKRKTFDSTSVEDMKSVVGVKDDFACRDKSEIIAYFGIL